MSLRDSTRQSMRHHRMLRTLLAVLSTAMLTAFQPISLAVQPQGTSRTIVSDDFTKHRKGTASVEPRTKASGAQSSNNTPSRPRASRKYRLASSTASKTKPISRTTAVSQLGITIWRLRPVKANDTGARVLVREKGKASDWVPERAEADATFREGDHVRLSIEAPGAGYLYVIDRDLFADGTTGGAMLIYPWANMLGGDNEMRPGKLVDIPAQEDDPSYFTARLSSPDQVGEILTLIVTSAPLDLPISDKPFQISNIQVAKWEQMWAGQNERFEMEGGAGEAWTKQEQQAAARKGTRQLTRDDPAPQTIYRISAGDNKAVLVNVRLRYAK
jgi:hypothetical protein